MTRRLYIMNIQDLPVNNLLLCGARMAPFVTPSQDGRAGQIRAHTSDA